MTIKDKLNNEYFNWMYDIVCADRFSNDISYQKLLMYLHNTVFKYSIRRDSNRADDGVSLRYRFAHHNEYDDVHYYITGPCSVLEMILALAIRCEENIMDDTAFGDRTGQWFWGMINNLGLGSMTDDRFDRLYVEEIIDRFLARKYEPNGKGGLFTVRNCDRDLRDVEIWFQLCYYLDSII
jgi:hypothetical protein